MNKNTKKYIIFSILLLLLLLLLLITFLYKLENFNNKYQDQEPPHYVSILAIMKDEAMNLKTWIDHYIWQGVDHIYLIDNGSTDDSINIVKELQNKGYPITLHELLEQHSQVKHYTTVYDKENIPKKSKWLIIADLDEFFYCPNSTIKTELHNHEDKPVIYSYWRMFGSDNLDKHPKDIRLSITHRKQELHELYKPIIQTKYITSDKIDVHNIPDYPITSENTLSEIFCLNHYPIQSKEYFEKVKMKRADVHHEWADNVRDWNYFKSYDENTDFEDTVLKNMILNI